MLKLENVTLKKGDKTLLERVSMQVEAGQIVAIIGPNGAGKSSALKVMSGDYVPDKGQVTLNTWAMPNLCNTQLAQLRAVMTQGYELSFPFSVKEVIEMGAFAFADQLSCAEHQKMLKQVIQLVDVEALLTRAFTVLSGGEQQRVQLARVLLQLLPALDKKRVEHAGTPYLLIDEPTASLDLFHQYQVMDIAKNMANQGAGVVAVLHDLSLAASFADYIYVMQQGAVVAEGAPEQVLKPELLQSVYHMHAHLHRAPQCHPHLQISTIR